MRYRRITEPKPTPWDDYDEGETLGAIIRLGMCICILWLGDRWRTIVRWALVLGTLIIMYQSLHHPLAQFGALAGVVILSGLSYVLTAAGLENQNCATVSTFSLWQRHGSMKGHLLSAGLVMVSVVGLCLVINAIGSVSVNPWGIIATGLGYPALILLVGYLTVASHARFVSREDFLRSQ